MSTDADRRRIHGPLRPADEDRGLSPFGKLLIAYCVLITALTIGASLYFTEPPAAASTTMSEANAPTSAVEAGAGNGRAGQ